MPLKVQQVTDRLHQSRFLHVLLGGCRKAPGST
ncbi:hypothetical protein PMI16_02120 [Herbaspirillum sp. CF444]|nr:hypothetical protein PMI16_02120 [Herbaspirillum sp. CF444]